METVRMEEMTSPQIRRAIEEGFTTVIVSAGAIEQHGKHLPIGMDAMDSVVFSERIARELGNALSAPVIRPGCSDHHMDFAGSLTISEPLMQEVCWAYCRCLDHHGFENIVLMSTHGGNIRAMSEVASKIDAELDARVVWVNTLRDPKRREQRAVILEKYDVTPEEAGSHSGFIETSLLMATDYAKFIDMDSAECGWLGNSIEKIAEVSDEQGRWNISHISPIGVLGDPLKSSLEAGRELLDLSVQRFTEIVREALAA